MADPNILMGIKTAQFMNPLDAAAQASQVKRSNLQNAMFQQEMDTQSKLDKAYQMSGGDVSKMQADPSIGYKAGMEINTLKAQQAQNAFKAQNEKLDYLLKESEYSAQQASGVKDQAGWDRVRNHVLQTLGPDAAAHMPEQYSEEAKQQLIDGAMTFKDRIAQQRADQQAMQQDRMYNATMERIAASERNAAQRSEGTDKPQKIEWDETRGVFVDPNTRTFIAPTGQDGSSTLPQKPESSAEKTARLKLENETRIADKDFANSLDAANAAKDLLPKATGSGFGAMRDKGAALFGTTTEGAQNAAKLKVIAGKLVAAVPKFSGPQSDKDVQLYREMAGQVGDDTLPYETRQAALETVIALQSAEADRRKLISGGNQPQAPSASFDPSAFHR